MGGLMLIGGFAGSALGVWLFAILRRIGQVELFISLAYALLLSTLGVLMMIESTRSLLRRRRGTATRRKLHQHTWLHGLPFKLRFRRSKLYTSALLPIILGFLVGILSAVLGVGGGFVMVPAMIYLLRMPTAIVPGTSLFQIIFVTAVVTLLQAVENNTVDVVLAMVLLIGGVVGAQLGTRWGARLRGEELRALLALIVLAVAAKLVFDLTVRPDNLFSLGTLEL
jgi:uncharacterized protein